MDRQQICKSPKWPETIAASAAATLRVLEGKWKLAIIIQLFAAGGPLRFSELERRVEGATQKMLIQQLKELEKDSIIIRTVYPQVPPKVEYALSETGIALSPALDALVDWTLLRCKASGDASEGV